MNKNVNKTKRKLTIIFAVLVFLLAVILEIIYFSTKFYTLKKNDASKFINITRNIESRFLSVDDFLNAEFKLEQFKKYNKSWFIDKFLNTNQVNILLINKDENSIIFSKIYDNIEEDFLLENINSLRYNKYSYHDWFYFKKNILKKWNNKFEIIFFKKSTYDNIDYIIDLVWFILLTIIFSILFYYIWYKFVNKIFKPVEENINDMQNFVHNAWHEFKTPISVIHWNMQLLNELKKYDKKLTNESIKEIEKLDKLIVWLIELTDISNNWNNEKINLSDEIKLILKNYKSEIKSKDITIKIDLTENIILNINKQYFYILFSNLFLNAIKYNKKWWEINIELNKNSLIISDTGIWLNKKDINKIFDRFYQANPTRNSDWFWIWLSLVKKITSIYKWKIKIQSKENEYTKFIINF